MALSEAPDSGGALVKPQYVARTSSGRLIAAPPGPSYYPGGISHGSLQMGHVRKRNRKPGRLRHR